MSSENTTSHENGAGTSNRVTAISQALIAGGVVGVWLWLFIAEQNVPGELTAVAGGVVGWYFRGGTRLTDVPPRIPAIIPPV